MVQQAVLLAKPAVALVTSRVDAEATVDCGAGPVTVKPSPFMETGTAWFIDGRGYLITNAHVVDPAHRLPPWVIRDMGGKAVEKACVEPVLAARGLRRGERPELEAQIRARVPLSKVTLKPVPQITVLLSSGKLLAAEVKKFSPPISIDTAGNPAPDSGRDLALLRVPEGVYPALVLTEKDATIGQALHIIGFPGVVLHHELLNKSAALEASVTSGLVSGFKQDAIGQDVLQTDAPAAPGNSGGPAVGNRANVIGVLTFVSLSASGENVQGFNFLIPARDVRKFLDGTAVANPGGSRFSAIWEGGLRDLDEGRFSRAAKAFAEVDALLPGLPDVKRAIAEAEFKIKNPPPRPFPWAWATAAVTLASVGGYGGMWGRRWWKNRFRIRSGQVIELMSGGRSPVLVDARTQSDFETSPLELPRAIRLAPQDAEAGKIDLHVEPNQTVVAYCASPEEQTSARVAQLLRQRGFKDVRILKGGLGSWTNAGLPVSSKASLPSIGIEIYKTLTAGDIERRRVSAGEMIVSEGEEANNEAYVVHSGKVEIHRRFNGTDKLLTTHGEGELFGEMALFRKSTRAASAIAATDVELLVIKAEKLDWLIRNRPQLTLEILKRLSEMIAQGNQPKPASTR
jgi:rhodanese-related sulfurtransferase